MCISVTFSQSPLRVVKSSFWGEVRWWEYCEDGGRDIHTPLLQKYKGRVRKSGREGGDVFKWKQHRDPLWVQWRRREGGGSRHGNKEQLRVGWVSIQENKPEENAGKLDDFYRVREEPLLSVEVSQSGVTSQKNLIRPHHRATKTCGTVVEFMNSFLGVFANARPCSSLICPPMRLWVMSVRHPQQFSEVEIWILSQFKSFIVKNMSLKCTSQPLTPPYGVYNVNISSLKPQQATIFQSTTEKSVKFQICISQYWHQITALLCTSMFLISPSSSGPSPLSKSLWT